MDALSGMTTFFLERKARGHRTVIELASLEACPDCGRLWQEHSCGPAHYAVGLFQELNYAEIALGYHEDQRTKWLPEPQDGWAALGRTLSRTTRCDACGAAAFPFMVRDQVWTDAFGLDATGIRCVTCVERGLGRFLRPDDFTDVPLNTALRFGIEVGRGTRDVTQDDVTLRVPVP